MGLWKPGTLFGRFVWNLVSHWVETIYEEAADRLPADRSVGLAGRAQGSFHGIGDNPASEAAVAAFGKIAEGGQPLIESTDRGRL
jgi:hypothetical protein